MTDRAGVRLSYRIGHAKLYELVADTLEEQILGNPAMVGSKLPSEQELADGFSVSRPVVREALKLLKERRLVSVRNGEGVYVEKPDAGALASVLHRVITMDNVQPDSVYELRVILEPANAALAAERADDGGLAALEAQVQRMINNRHDHAARVEDDFAFHLAIAQMTGNPLLIYFLSAVKDLFRAMMEPAVSTPTGNERGILYHQRILAALKSRDSQRARHAMQEHLTACRGDYGLPVSENTGME